MKKTRTSIGKSLNVIGLMSGTSADGVDAALVRITGHSEAVKVKPLAFSSLPYPRGLQPRIVSAAVEGSVAEICHLNAVLGEWFSRAALRVIAQAGFHQSQVHLIGSHGQTIHHLPTPVRGYGLGPIRSTLQIAEPAIIAERTGITTVANFRPRDMAVGGEGAPLTPYAHYMLLSHPRRSRLIVNLGGIGNVTYLPAGQGLESVKAFDTGPGNMVLDGLMRQVSGGRFSMDRHGRLAGTGTVKVNLLNTMLAHPFLKKRPPKSTGREEFGGTFLARILTAARGRIRPEDLLATASRYTAVTVGLARRWLPGPVEEVIVAGGGVHNRTVLADLATVFDPIPITKLDDLGWDSHAFEAIAFALFAYQTIHSQCTNVPSVTGASYPVVLGHITPGHDRRT